MTYECTVMGGLFTVWRGSIFECTGGEVTLRHSRFTSDVGVCNNITGRGLSINDQCYTSQLNIALREELEGRTVTCSVDGTQGTSLVGNETLKISRSM